jgi:WD40 repeat protein
MCKTIRPKFTDSALKAMPNHHYNCVTRIRSKIELTNCEDLSHQSYQSVYQHAFVSLLSLYDLVSGSEDTFVHIVETADQGVKVTKLEGHPSAVTCAVWNYDESIISSADIDGRIILWRI